MPGSKRENNEDVRRFVAEHRIGSALDVGPGRGTYSRILGDLIPVMDAVEVWEPYIGRYDLASKYRTVTLGDVRQHADFGYDLVICGDVLEHMPREDSIGLWKRIGEHARFSMLSVPVIHYPQHALKGNPFEVHQQEDLTPDEVRRDYGPFVLDRVYKVTGTFVRQWR